jgi:pseudouridine synthase
MRVNKFIASATGLSRRAADLAISQHRVTINGQPASLGANIHDDDIVLFNGRSLKLPNATQTILLNKPPGYVCSRDGQGSSTIYDLLPKELHHLKSIGRLDKDSSGLILLTNDGTLAHHLAHPGSQKEKRYNVHLNKPLQPADQTAIEGGIKLIDGVSHLKLAPSKTPQDWEVTMHEGRNRQIRRTFEARGYEVLELERTQFGEYTLEQLKGKLFMLL